MNNKIHEKIYPTMNYDDYEVQCIVLHESQVIFLHLPGTSTPYTLASCIKRSPVKMLATSFVETFSPFHLHKI